MIQITPLLAIDESEVHEDFIHAGGPGGQNVNKVATAVQLRFDVVNSQSLPDPVRTRLLSLARSSITENGILIIDARRFRTQKANREDALHHLTELIREAAKPPKIRRKTRPTLSSKLRRLASKNHRARIKNLRRSKPDLND